MEFGVSCSIAVHDYRERKTGPMHDLAVLRCEVHQHCFTVYPPGFVPYARRQVLNGPVQHDVPSLVDTVHRVVDTGPWGHGITGEPAGSWSTLNRLLDRVSQMFGLQRPDSRVAVAVAYQRPLAALDVAASAAGCRAKAHALAGLLNGLCLSELLGLGALGGCWGRPHYWRAERDQLVPIALSRGPPMNLGR